MNMANIPKNQKALYLFIRKIDLSIYLDIYKIPRIHKAFGQYFCIPKTLPGPQYSKDNYMLSLHSPG